MNGPPSVSGWYGVLAGQDAPGRGEVGGQVVARAGPAEHGQPGDQQDGDSEATEDHASPTSRRSAVAPPGVVTGRRIRGYHRG